MPEYFAIRQLGDTASVVAVIMGLGIIVQLGLDLLKDWGKS